MNRLYIVIMLILAFLMNGCSIKKTSEEKIADMEYTVVEDEDVPDELMDIINDKKEEVFNITFSDKEYLYMVRGYGPQPTTGYGIKIENLYETDNAICIMTTLRGPLKTEKINEVISYPYIVIKVENVDKEVLFK